MRRAAAVLLAGVCAGFPAAARADLFSSVSYGVHVSSIGAGITVEKPLLYDFSARIVTGSGSYSAPISYEKTSYTATTKFNNVSLIADFRPYGGRYRLSGGVLFGSDRINSVAQPVGDTIRVGSGTYAAGDTGTVSTRLAFDHPSLYAGVGTGTGLVRGLALTFDGGVLLRNGTSSASATGPLASDPAFRANLAQLRGELRTHIIVPVASVGVVFRP